jgi:predicted nuclease with TOPRIM domain
MRENTKLKAEVERLTKENQSLQEHSTESDAHENIRDTKILHIILDKKALQEENATLKAELQGLKDDFNHLNEGGLKQIATLKKALKLAAAHINYLTHDSDCHMKPNSEYCMDTISCIDCIQQRFIRQAQEEGQK